MANSWRGQTGCACDPPPSWCRARVIVDFPEYRRCKRADVLVRRHESMAGDLWCRRSDARECWRGIVASEFRPFRAEIFVGTLTQGVALGYRIAAFRAWTAARLQLRYRRAGKG